MKKLLLTRLNAMLPLTSCEWFCCGVSDCDCDPAEIICGEPSASVSTCLKDETLTVCDLQRQYFVFTWHKNGEWPFDSIEWDIPDEAFGVEIREDIMAFYFRVNQNLYNGPIGPNGPGH
jgi:hypothetical protein